MTKRVIETYYQKGVWKSRRQGSSRAFAVGGTKEEQQEIGSRMARRDGVDHVVLDAEDLAATSPSHAGPRPRRGAKSVSVWSFLKDLLAFCCRTVWETFKY